MKNTRIYRGEVPDLILPDHIADWNVHDYWERERYDSMAENLGPDDCLWIVGAEHGYMAALWSRLCGSTVLIEPSPPFWQNIRLTWEANNLTMPEANIQAFVSDSFSGITTVNVAQWPDCAEGDEECPAQAYKYLWEPKHAGEVSATTIDDLVRVGVPLPTAISVDTEGAEVRILPGARKTLKENDVKSWISVHPDLIRQNFPDHHHKEVRRLFDELGYRSAHLATDHEQHWYFYR